MIRSLVVMFVTLAAAAPAGEMSFDDFLAYADGLTLYFAQDGKPYGVEQYLKGQRSVWQYADGTCARGVYYPRQRMICFAYDGESEEICWTFFRNNERVTARVAGGEAKDDLEVIGRDRKPVACRGPGVGV